MELRQVFDDLVRFDTVRWNAIDARLRLESGVPLGGASQAVDRLDRAGRCRRVANPADRRSSILELTADGEQLLAAAGTVFEQQLGSPYPAESLPEKELRR